MEKVGKGLTVNVDVDGVLYDFTDAMREAFDYRYGQGDKHKPSTWPDPKTWRLHDSWPVSREEVFDVMYAEILDEILFRVGTPIDYAPEGMRWLKAAGFHVRVVTSKTFRDPRVTERARISTLRWLYDNEIPYDTISFTSADKGGKRGILADVVIDDKPTLDWAQSGAINLIFNQQWNKVIPSIPNEVTELNRVFGWQDLMLLLPTLLDDPEVRYYVWA